MTTKTQNFYGVTLSLLTTLPDRVEVKFTDALGHMVVRRSKKNSPLLDNDLHGAMLGQYPIDIIVDGRGSIVWVSKHDFNFDLSAVSVSISYSVWAFSKSGDQILHTPNLLYGEASDLASALNKGGLEEKISKAADFQHLGEVAYRVVREVTSYEVLDF